MNPSVTIHEVLSAREDREKKQKNLLAIWNKPLICLTLNIVGSVKVFPLSIRAFDVAIRLINETFDSFGYPLHHFEANKAKTGFEAFWIVEGMPFDLKTCMTQIEEDETIGRIFDIDVILPDGLKISRKDVNFPERKCFLCGENAFVCGRSRTHTVKELLEHECHIISQWLYDDYATNIATKCTQSLIFEVTASPKPGLVDRFDSGANDDMDIFTFNNSALALSPYFKKFVLQGIKFCNKSEVDLFESLRLTGIQAEYAMLKSTGGINTHKGIIFSAALLCGALGFLYGREEPATQQSLSRVCQSMTLPLQSFFEQLTPKTAQTHGEQLYVKYGIKGARGEAMNGFPTLFHIALPAFKEYISEGFSLNDAGIYTLLNIIALTEDTNIISRSNYETMQNLKTQLNELMASGNYKSYSFIEGLNKEMIKMNINPGGSADLLALTYFMYFLDL